MRRLSGMWSRASLGWKSAETVTGAPAHACTTTPCFFCMTDILKRKMEPCKVNSHSWRPTILMAPAVGEH